jgi:adenosine deaminase
MGHGVPCLDRPELVELIRKKRIHLEVCPTSNIQTNTFDTYADHPIDELYRLGVSVGVNTDSRTISNVTMSEEYEKLHRTFGWGSEEFYNCNRNALDAAFISEDVRERLMAQLTEGYQQVI